ncbi:MAG: hypothetical protein KatS3mg085_634 [Candidatus Dojkabacteria bacterium]|nr:MAG: hypothetical protein KatS3mg085_634 [Candidatus Dojkabacteria bacterium]
MNALQIVGIVISIVLSLFGIIVPKSVSKFLGLNSEDRRGDIEIMATYGGFFLGLSITALVLNSSAAFDTLAGGWVGAGIVRLIAIGKYKKFYPISIVLVGFELLVGAILFLA